VELPASPSGRVYDVGFLNEAEKRAAIAEAVALVQPSLHESFGIVLLEAWLAETPDPTEGLRLYAHVLAAEHVWLRRIQDRPREHSVWPEPTLEQVATLRSANRDEFAALPVGANDLERVIAYSTTDGSRHFESRVEDILMHVLTHGSYHRGQIARAIKAGGGEARSTDYIIWAMDLGDAPA